MRFLESALGPARASINDEDVVDRAALFGSSGWDAGDVRMAAAESAMRISAVNACVTLISTVTAGLPLKIMRKRAVGPDGKRRGSDPATEHPLYRLLHDQPNNYQDAFEWRRMMTTHLLLRGNGISEIVPGPSGPFDQLIPIHPDRVTIERTRAGVVLYHIQAGTRCSTGNAIDNYRPEARTLLAEEVFHLKDLSDGLWGLSRIEQFRQEIEGMLLSMAYGRAYFRNNAEASVAICVDGKLNETQRTTMLAGWKAAHGGVHKMGGATVLEGGVKIEKLSLTNRDSQFLELRQSQIGDIARIFLVPPHLIGDVTKESSWGTGIEQMDIAFLTFTEMAYINTWEKAIQRQLLGNDQEFFPFHVVDGLLRGDTASRYEAFERATGRPWMAVNEARERENLPAVEGGDELAQVQQPQSGGGERIQRGSGSAMGRLAKFYAGKVMKLERKIALLKAANQQLQADAESAAAAQTAPRLAAAGRAKGR